MLAARVGVVGTFVAMLVLSAELVGAIALRQHIVGDERTDRSAKLQRIEASLRDIERQIGLAVPALRPGLCDRHLLKRY
jgi:hypothetical protein